jgi:hypothetical protein
MVKKILGYSICTFEATIDGKRISEQVPVRVVEYDDGARTVESRFPKNQTLWDVIKTHGFETYANNGEGFEPISSVKVCFVEEGADD